jgi:serine phosphatase RsbU (regulator of sigma subunit)/streptogramin lyase
MYSDPDGVMWFATGGNTEPAFDGGVSRYDGKGFVNFTPADGLAGSMVYAVYGDPDGVMWFGTFSGGVSRYDSSGFVNFTREDGLLRGSAVLAVYADPDGTMWLGTSGGVSRYDGEEFVNFTTREGLVDNFVRTVRGGPENTIWFGTASGVSRYDGKDFVNFTIKDGLVGDDINDIHRTPDGTMWFGTWGDGISRYDGKEFVSFTEKDGLASNAVFAIQGDPDGVLWFGTWDGGASRYDGRDFVNFTIKDGLVGDDINDIHRTPDGALWFGARGGVSRYDGGEFLNFTIKDGLASNIVNEIYHDRDGVIWFSTGGGGVAGYDNTAWTSLDTRDGLAHNIVWSAYQNSNGDLWFGTYKGATRYRRSTTRPRVRIVSVTTDQTYRDLSGIPAFMPDTRVTFEYSSIDFKTIPEKRQYRCRIREIDSDWRKPTKSDTFDYIFGKSGTYTFEVQAIDRDLNYSEPASLALRVVPPFYLRAVFLVPTIGSGAIVLATVAFLATALTKRRRQVHAYELMAVRELQDAREMQMSLLPEAAPPVENIEIAGRSIPANTVGGDFFDYLVLADGKIGIAIADISGKGLRAAMNALMTSGMLYEVVKTEMSCGSVLSALNAGLYPRMEKQTFAAFSFATLSQDPERIQWSNAAQPRPLIKRDGAVSEFEGEGGLPLGMMPGVTYPDWELKLQAGDIVLLYTDGIIEAENEAEEMYGAERLERSVVSIDSTMGAEDIIEAILRDVSDFVGSAQQYDDMTVVVLKKL